MCIVPDAKRDAKSFSKQGKRIESTKTDETISVGTLDHCCQRCSNIDIFVQFSEEWKQQLCPWCMHWLALSESAKEVMFDPKEVRITTDMYKL